MTRDEAIERVFQIDFWGARSYNSSLRTATRIVDDLVAQGVLTLERQDK